MNKRVLETICSTAEGEYTVAPLVLMVGSHFKTKFLK